MVTAGTVLMPSIGLYMLNRNDPRWKDIKDWERDANWIIMPPDPAADPIRIPKPDLFGIFGTGLERSLEYLEGKDPEAFQKLAATVAGGLAPRMQVPLGLQLPIELAADYSMFRQGPIDPPGKAQSNMAAHHSRLHRPARPGAACINWRILSHNAASTKPA